MIQILQYENTGAMSGENLPVLKTKKGSVIVRAYFSLISAGTERIPG
jgi:hypothetical protein